jgi:iron complex outermembrane recepter protein
MSGVAIGARGAGIALWAGLSCATPIRDVAAADAQTSNDLEEVVVTGTHIHGADAAGSKPIVIAREQIDASGYQRIEDVLATVTQNVNRGNAAVQDGNEVNNFFDRGAEVQLRGLGVGTTLVLVNGQRQGESGYQGSFTDVSSIPASAVERIEILPEGASALYGSDAIGGVVNIILRKDFEGLEARARIDGGRKCHRAHAGRTLGPLRFGRTRAAGPSIRRQPRPGLQCKSALWRRR